MTTAKIKAIYIARKAGDNVSGHQKVSLKAGKGIVGDRYYSESGANRSSFKGQPDWEITLIESEVIEAFNRATGNKFHDSDFRRNLVTEGIELNNLVGKNFTIDGSNSEVSIRMGSNNSTIDLRLEGDDASVAIISDDNFAR